MSFGLCNALVTFTRLINRVLKQFNKTFVAVNFDNILIYSRSKKDHVNHLRDVLEKMREEKLFLNFKKCEFLTESLIFLRFVISSHGIPKSMVSDKEVKFTSHFCKEL